MTISWLKSNNSYDLFLKGKYSFYPIKMLNPNHIVIINMWVKDCRVDSFWFVNIDKIPDLKKKKIFFFSHVL